MEKGIQKMNKIINDKIALLWNQIRKICKGKREEKPDSYWFSFFEEELEKRLYAIGILKELRGKL